MIHTKNDLLTIYNDLKSKNHGLPLKYRDFLKASGINKRVLVQVFGAEAYTKLQKLSGDTPNRLILEKTSLDKIMRAYGDIATEVIGAENKLPTAAHWAGKDLRPTESGLSKTHKIKWSEFPRKFYEYCAANSTLKAQYKNVLKFIEPSNIVKTQNSQHKLLNNVYSEILKWSPALRRSSEEAYKSELSLFLKQVKALQKKGLDIREEKGDSRCDIAIGTQIGIEIKKSPSLSEYDRCFGQIARHLKCYEFVIVTIFDVPKQDQFEDFSQLVEMYFKDSVLVIKNG